MFRKHIYQIVILLFLAFASLHAFATKNNGNNKSDWNLAKESNGISLYYRWVTRGDSIKTREMKTEFTIDAEIQEILSHLRDTESYKNCAAGIKECSIEKISNSVWFTHTIMNYPWPLKQKDLVTRHFVEQNEHEVIINRTQVITLRPHLIFFQKLKGLKGYKTTREHGIFLLQ